MTAAQPTPDALALRESRIAVLRRLIDFGLPKARDLKRRGVEATGLALPRLRERFLRLWHWVSLAFFLIVRIREGAFEAPPPRRKAPRLQTESFFEPEDLESLEPLESFDPFDCLRRSELAAFERYLDRPFGKVVAQICRGLGMKPDWDAWSQELWARGESLPSGHERDDPADFVPGSVVGSSGDRFRQHGPPLRAAERPRSGQGGEPGRVAARDGPRPYVRGSSPPPLRDPLGRPSP